MKASRQERGFDILMDWGLAQRWRSQLFIVLKRCSRIFADRDRQPDQLKRLSAHLSGL